MNQCSKQKTMPKNINITRAAILFALCTLSMPTLPVGPNTIVRYASTGKLAKLQELYQDGVDLTSIRDKHGATLLHKAILHESKSLPEWLIDTVGISVDCQDSYQNTPLQIAIKYLKPSAVDWLVHEKNASLQLRDIHNYTPLARALLIMCKLACTNEIKDINDIHAIIDSLLKNDDGTDNRARINAGLLTSVRLGARLAIKYLLQQYKADITTTSRLGTTVLHRAIKYDKTPLIPELVEMYDADIHARDRSGQTPLMLALQRLKGEHLNRKKRIALEEALLYLARFTDFETEFKDDDEKQAVTQAIQAVMHPTRYGKALRKDQNRQKRLHQILNGENEEIRLPDDLEKLLMSFAASQLPEPRTAPRKSR